MFRTLYIVTHFVFSCNKEQTALLFPMKFVPHPPLLSINQPTLLSPLDEYNSGAVSNSGQDTRRYKCVSEIAGNACGLAA